MSLLQIQEVIRQILVSIGPVCVVSIAGPYRKGKSYILSEAFDQPDVFPLGHQMVPETMGIWLWIVPGKYKVCFFVRVAMFPCIINTILSPSMLILPHLGLQRTGIHSSAPGL